MTVASYSTPYVTKPYLTPDEFTQFPTALDVSSLVPDGSDAQNESALLTQLRRASGLVDVYCDQILAATLDVETKRCSMRRDGTLYVHPDHWPILEVRDVSYGSAANQLHSIGDLSAVFVEPHAFTVPFGVGRMSSVGPLDFGSPSPGAFVFVRYSYVNGWPNTTLASDAVGGSSTCSVKDATGIYAGTQLTLYDKGETEDVVVAALVGNALTLATPLQSDHLAGCAISALPYAVKEATALIAVALVQTRGDVALVLGSLRSGGEQKQTEAVTGDLPLAKELLASFKRVR